MKQANWAILAIGILGLSISSCQKKEKYNTTAAEDNAMAEAAFSDVFNQVDYAVRTDTAVYRSQQAQQVLNTCATVTVSPTGNVWPKNVVIDFGPTNCTDAYGKNRRGKINVSITGRYHEQGTVTTITPQDYYVNDMKVEGTKTVTNNGPNAAGNLTWSINVSNAKVTNADKSITWNSSRTRVWSEGSSTIFNIFDDVYEITGSANGTSSEGDNFTVSITQPLVVKIGCRWITKGGFDLTVDNLPVRSVDYGSGNCDSQATLTINNKTYNITLQ